MYCQLLQPKKPKKPKAAASGSDEDSEKKVHLSLHFASISALLSICELSCHPLLVRHLQEEGSYLSSSDSDVQLAKQKVIMRSQLFLQR